MAFEPTEQQAKAIRSLDRPLSITAGAGSGKTRVLAERFVTSIDAAAAPEGWTPAGVDEALVVTFTEKAAGEIAERVRRVLLEHGLIAEARRIDEAWISTIHGLCQRLLRSHALEAGLDPGFTVISTVDAGVLRETVFEQVLRDALASGKAEDLFATYGLAAVEQHAAVIHDRLRAMGATLDDVEAEDAVDAGALLAEGVAALREWATRLDFYAKTATLARVIGSLQTGLTAVEALAGQDLDDRDVAREVLRALQAVKLLRSVGTAKDAVLEIAEERRALLDRAVRAVVAPLERSLLDVMRAFAEGYEAAKSGRGALDFEDLQLRAVRLLCDAEGPADRYRRLFRLVMIDEFQDTNEVQTILADLLSDGDLCTVGDERQSIYAFRYADVEIYRRHTAGMLASGAETVALSTNFRSHAAVLAFVNEVFASPELFGPGFLRLEHGRDESSVTTAVPATDPRIDLLLVDRKAGASASGRAMEADAVARRLRELVDAGVPQGEIVVLLRAMTHADEYARALRAHDLEAVTAAGGTFFGRSEVEAVRALLRAISNPLDDEALAVVLASDLTGISNDGLMRLRRAAGTGPLWRAMEAAGLDERDSHAAMRTRGVISSARGRQGRVPIAGLVLHAFEELDLDLRLLESGPEGRRRYANVLKLARLADEFEGAGGSGVRSFLEHLALKERFADREAPASVVDERVDAIRVMTVHGAKGLEFPVVAIPELGRDLVTDRSALILEKEERGARLALSLPDDGASAKAAERRSSWASEARLRARERDVEEEKRLLYVACTRAREMLVLSGAQDLDKPCGEQAVGWIRAALGLAEAPLGDGVIDAIGARVAVRVLDGSAMPPAPSGPRVSGGRPEGGRERAVPAATSPETGAMPATPPAISYSAMRLYELCPLRYFVTSVARVGAVRTAAAHDPMRLGEAVHAALRLISPEGAAPAAERLSAVARRWSLSQEDTERLLAAVGGFAASAACAEAHAAGAPSREVPFAVPLGAVTLIGRLDLVYERGDATVVIDYKTGPDALADGASTQDHRLQADCYALAALAGGAADVEVTFIAVEALEGGQPRSATFRYGAGEAAALRADIGARAVGLAAGPYEPLASYDPRACCECPAARSVCPVNVSQGAAARRRT